MVCRFCACASVGAFIRSLATSRLIQYCESVSVVLWTITILPCSTLHNAAKSQKCSFHSLTSFACSFIRILACASTIISTSECETFSTRACLFSCRFYGFVSTAFESKSSTFTRFTNLKSKVGSDSASLNLPLSFVIYFCSLFGCVFVSVWIFTLDSMLIIFYYFLLVHRSIHTNLSCWISVQMFVHFENLHSQSSMTTNCNWCVFFHETT